MDITQIYMASPDWLKLAWLVVPWLTVYGLARLWRDVRLKASQAGMPAQEAIGPVTLTAADLERLRAEGAAPVHKGLLPPPTGDADDDDVDRMLDAALGPRPGG